MVYREFQDSQGYTEKPCLKKRKKRREKKRKRKKEKKRKKRKRKKRKGYKIQNTHGNKYGERV